MKNQPARPIILMADDDADDRLLARDALQEAGVEADLRFVENGEELMNYLHHRHPDAAEGGCPRPALVLLDMNMPLKDGPEALREMKSDPDLRRIPVVMLTTSKADTDISRLYDLGVNSFITKPFQFEAFVKVMRNIGNYWFQTVELPASR